MEKFKGARPARLGNINDDAVEEDAEYIIEHGLDNKVVRIAAIVRYRDFTEYLCIIDKPDVHKALGWVTSEASDGHEKIESYIDIPYEVWENRAKIEAFFKPFSLAVFRHCYVQPLLNNKDAKIVLDTI